MVYQGPTLPPPFPPVPNPLHFTILIPHSDLQSDVIRISQTSSPIFYPLPRKYSKPSVSSPFFLKVSSPCFQRSERFLATCIPSQSLEGLGRTRLQVPG